jgi:hypothetical protein
MVRAILKQIRRLIHARGVFANVADGLGAMLQVISYPQRIGEAYRLGQLKLLAPGILHPRHPVKHGLTLAMVLPIRHKVPMPLELKLVIPLR